ncbi:rab GTPase-binding effector protein 1 isoform X1 [Schistocerca nitens]|uniref:rab GTPase-binding effector protein 1 isoform X1 n=1 Tax=Schistocerca nitens TaxID=7011 RepID=UPI002118CC5A|nr:rab GTPase-binding effector protein 1 isoform X1 [Schistocerca nitens]
MENTSHFDDSPELKPEGEGVMSRVAELMERIKELETEKQQAKEEFGIQRAKLKELYLQKEEELKRSTAEQERLTEENQKLSDELGEAKSQLLVAGFHVESGQQAERKCQEEIATLQQLVHETQEYENEVKQLQKINKDLEQEVHQLRAQVQQHQGTSDRSGRDSPILAPSVMLSAVTKTLARKVVSQLGADASSVIQDNNLEDSMRKVKKYAQEDAEVLRSVVIPLEEEIKVLKQKLRKADEQLMRYQSNMDDSISFHDDLGTPILKDTPSFQVKSPNRTTSLVNLSGVESPSGDTGGHQNFPAESPKTNKMNSSMSSLLSLNESHCSLTKQSPDSHSPAHDELTKSITDAQSEEKPKHTCDMCANYEAQLVRSQQEARELEKKVAVHERSLQRYREDLSKESEFRKEMEEKWNEKKEEHKTQVAELKSMMESSEAALSDLNKVYTETIAAISDQLARLAQDREKAQNELERLQAENDNLVGKHTAHSEQLQNEIINLPDKVEDLQELLLKFREELISAKVAKEAIEAKENVLRCEIQLLQEEQGRREDVENTLKQDLGDMRKKLEHYEKERLHNHEKQGKLETALTGSQRMVTDLKKKVAELEKDKEKMEGTISELKGRISSLQRELTEAETVQKDFVRLSQSLQVQLEKIRGSDTEVRWQHEDDVEVCPGCRQNFTIARKKQHCRHCGRIFCPSCLTHTVSSGPNNRPSRVCDVCHTLLVKDTAPYFSTEPPHTPD